MSFDLVYLAEEQALATTTARWIFLSCVAFAVKVPLFPVHTWLPDAHTNAPTAGSVILAGVMLKLGTYGFLRFGIYLFPEASVYRTGARRPRHDRHHLRRDCGDDAKDLKRLVAYSSVAHLGFIVIGTFALNTEGLSGGLLQMVNHGISTGALFLLVGWIYDRRHTRLIAELGGLQKPAVFAAVFMVVMLSSIGLPGLNGFVGEFLALLGALRIAGGRSSPLPVSSSPPCTCCGPTSGSSTAPPGDNAEMKDLTWSEGAIMMPFLRPSSSWACTRRPCSNAWSLRSTP